MTNKATERERGRRRRRDVKIAKLQAALAEKETATAVETVEPTPVDLSDPAQVIADWCAANLIVPNGLLAGQPFRLEDWQIDFLRDAFADGVREAALTTPRKLGKSGLIAALLLCFLAGPLNRPGWRCIVVSFTGNLAKELRRQVAEIADVSGLSKTVKDYSTPTPGRIIGANGAEVTILAADKSSGHAVGVDLTITDESGLLPESKRDLWDAVYSSVSTRNGRNLHISIRANGPMFDELRERRNHPAVVWHEYAADENADLLDRAQWHKANPGLGTIKSLDYMQDAAERAAATPAAASGFRTLDLNLPGSPTAEMIVSVPDYLRCVADTLPERAGDCWLALDVGGAAAFTAAAAFWPDTGRCELFMGIGGLPDLATRSRADGVGNLYPRMAAGGELWCYPGLRETPLQDFVTDLAARLDGVAVTGLVADEYRASRLLDAMDTAGLRQWAQRLEIRPVRWKQGNDDVVAFQGSVIGGRVVFPDTLVMLSAIRESQLVSDNNGNVRLDKSRYKGRIDVLTAAVLAVAAGERYRRVADTSPVTSGLIPW